MKKISIFLPAVAILASTSAFCSDGAAIKTQMDKIGDLFKDIVAHANQPDQDARLAGEAAQLAPLFAAVLNLTPDLITQMPSNEQADAVANYKKLIQQEIDDSNALTAAFQANDNDKANAVLADMNAIKKQGHDAYKPPQP